MTNRGNQVHVMDSSIESVTGWSGAQADELPSAVSATKPSAKHITGHQTRCFHVFNGGTVPKILTKSNRDVRLSSPLELKLAGAETSGRIRGYASAFGGAPDSYGDIIAKGAFARTISEHLRQPSMPAMLWAHDQASPIGRWIDMHEDDFGLHVTGELNLDTTGGKDAYAHLKKGDVNGMSIGYLIGPNGSKMQGASRLLTDIDLVEVSVVAIPANSRSRVSGVKSLQSKTDLIDMLREGGLSKAAAARIAGGGWPAMSGEDRSEKTIALANQLKRATAKLRKNQ